jgi:Flp pilus assembly protein TadG
MGFSSFMRRLKADNSGNALIFVALGMPVVIGSSGMAVDVAQWYTWKRELQYAVDQAALAGAWASAEPLQKDNYETLAGLEFTNNLSMLKDKVDDPEIRYEDWNGGTDNTVVATSTYSKSLPFTSIFWKNQATINVRAQASFQAATNYTTCLLALDPDADDAFELGGSVGGEVTCGVGSLSNSVSSIRKNGSTTLDVSDLIAAGGIDEDLAVNGQIHEFISNLSNPFDGLTPPESTALQSYICPADDEVSPIIEGSSTANVKTRTKITYVYYQGSNRQSAKTPVIYSGEGSNTDSDAATTAYGQALDFTPAEGYSEIVSDTGEQYTNQSWPSTAKKNTYIYEYRREVETKTFTNVVPDSGVVPISTSTAGNLQPGTYTDIIVGCDTYFNPGVYVITGELDFGQNFLVQGENVMLIFTGETDEQFKLNSQSVVNFTGITYDQLVNQYNVDEEDAEVMNGMIIYDPNSTQPISINGGANTIFDGILYMPGRHAVFNGDSTVAGGCMMIAAGTIKLTGNTTIQSLCIPENVSSFEIGGTTISVRLVA